MLLLFTHNAVIVGSTIQSQGYLISWAFEPDFLVPNSLIKLVIVAYFYFSNIPTADLGLT